MNCTYGITLIRENGGYRIAPLSNEKHAGEYLIIGNSIEEVRDKVFLELGMDGKFSEVFLEKELIAFKSVLPIANTPDEIRDRVNMIKTSSGSKAPTGSTRVTDFASQIAYGSKKATYSQFADGSPLQKASEKLNDIRMLIGTAIHSIIEDDSSSNLDKQVNHIINKIKNLLNWLSADTRNAILGFKDLNNLLIYLESIAKDSDPFKINLLAVSGLIKNYLNPSKYEVLLQESLIVQKDLNGVGILQGHPDMIVLDKETGEILIIDFKTSQTADMSDATKIYHYAQLHTYRKILSSWGIPENNIKLRNILITYNTTGINFNEDDDVVNPEANNQIDGQSSLKINIALNPFFPENAVALNDSKNRLELVKKRLTAICNGLMLKRFELESLINSLTIAAKNGSNKYLYSLEKTVTLSLSDDKKSIIAKDINDPTHILETHTIEDWAKIELEKVEQTAKELAREIRNVLLKKDVTLLKNWISYNKDYSKSFWQNLYKYCSPNYTPVACPTLEELGIIVVKHATRGYEFILLVSESSNLEFSRNPDKNILETLIKDKNLLKKYKESKELPRPSIGNLYALRALVAISEFTDVLDDNNKQISGIQVFSTSSGHTVGEINNELLIKTAKVLQQCCIDDAGKTENTNLFTTFADKLSKIKFLSNDELWGLKISDCLAAGSIEYGDSNLLLSDWDSYEDLQAKDEALEKIEKLITESDRYKNALSSMDAEGKSSSDDSIIYILNMIKTLRNLIRGMVSFENEMNSYSLSFLESIVAGINLLTKGSLSQFTQNGLKLTGLGQGLSASNAYASPSKLILRFQHFYDSATAQILLALQKEATELNKATEEYISYHKKFGDSFVGNHEEMYSNLFEKTKEGDKVNPSMLFQNPYSTNSNLTEKQKKYLEVVLWTINRHRSGIPNGIAHLSYSELVKRPHEYKAYINTVSLDSKLREIPLKLRGGVASTFSSLKSVMTNKKSIKDFAKEELQKARSIIEQEFLDDTLKLARDAAAKLRKKYINYFKENEIGRSTRIEQHSDAYDWEWNVNNLAIEYALADFKQKYFNDLLKLADNLLATITIIEQTTGLDLSKQTLELLDRIQINIYNKHLVNDEWTDVLTAMGVVKSGLALTKIAIRPTLLLKEMLLGRIRNTAAILANLIKQDEGAEIKMSHLMSAAKEVFGKNFFEENAKKIFGGLSIGHKSLANMINNTYAINDRDLSVIGEKFSYDRNGLHNLGSRMLYMNTIAPDWFNRMIIFIAKMKADGTWEAHKLNEQTGELEYDMSKDKRVAAFWNNRTKPQNTEEYQKAKEFYILKMLQFEREGWKNSDESSLKYSGAQFDPFPRAYTTLEEESTKEQIGLIYGYYSHQERATMLKGLWWTMYTQFLTFLPAEIRKNFAIGTESSIVKTIHLKDGITNKPLYWKTSESGLHETTTEQIDPDTKEFRPPVLETVHDPYEGLVVSTAKTVGLICRGDWDALRNNPLLLKNAELFLFNCLLGFLIAAIIAALISNGREKSTGLAIAADILTKTARELDVYHSVLEPIGGLGYVGSDFLANAFTTAFKTISNSGYSLYDFANSNLALVKDLHLNIEN